MCYMSRGPDHIRIDRAQIVARQAGELVASGTKRDLRFPKQGLVAAQATGCAAGEQLTLGVDSMHVSLI